MTSYNMSTLWFYINVFIRVKDFSCNLDDATRPRTQLVLNWLLLRQSCPFHFCSDRLGHRSKTSLRKSHRPRQGVSTLRSHRNKSPSSVVVTTANETKTTTAVIHDLPLSADDASSGRRSRAPGSSATVPSSQLAWRLIKNREQKLRRRFVKVLVNSVKVSFSMDFTVRSKYGIVKLALIPFSTVILYSTVYASTL